MKRQLYDLTDDPFVVFVNQIGHVLRAESIPHNIVGGVASQAYILNMLTKKHGKSVRDLTRDKEVRVQDYVRSTDDVDVALDLEGETDDTDKIRRITTEILPQFNFTELSPNGESILEFRAERVGASRPRYRVYVNDQGGAEDVVAMNIGRQPKDLHSLDPVWYAEFLDQGKEITIPYSEGYTLRLRVPRLEHLLASKISQSRAKDLMDNKNLASLAKDMGVELDFAEISRTLSPRHEDNYHRFLSAEYPAMNAS
jgi:hypothetical protein